MSKNSNFGPQTGPAPDFLRNTYDKQFQKLITTDFGELRPCFCKEVLPGDSLKIDPMVAIRSHPIVFPINTRIKFYCHFFYGRNRILYKDFEDFIFNTREGLTPPLLKLTPERAKKMISTNSLGDNLGIPSTIANGTSLLPVTMSPLSTSFLFKSDSAYSPFDALNFLVNNQKSILLNEINTTSIVYPSDDSTSSRLFGYRVGSFSSPLSSRTTRLRSNKLDALSASPISVGAYAILTDFSGVPKSPVFRITIQTLVTSDGVFLEYELSEETNSWYDISSVTLQSVSSYYLYIIARNVPSSVSDFNDYFPMPNSQSISSLPLSINQSVVVDGVLDSTDDRVIALNKFVGDNPVIPLSSLAMRLYEFICNYFYRNDQNNPYILDGVPQYNKFIPTDEGGWDTNEYLIHHRNWESDPFTTAVPSPQYGTAPLVGLTYSGGDTARVITNVTDSDGNTKELGITVGVDTDGTLTSVMQVDTGVPSGSLRRLMDGVDGIRLGMSINDLRNVNSFQRFLENVIRRGLRYRNQLLSHFGVSVDYPDIDIPQFIGGFSGDLTVMEVTNMAESSDVALGDVAGKINAVISSNHSISIYCPEHGFVMGIFSIVPVPTYSQILSTMFTRYSYLDYFQKEFDKIGYVPIFHRNFLPLQTDDPNKILGYQRAWWDYMCSFDEVNGDFRTSLADFVLYRQFKEMPTLNEEFLKVDSESLNNIFAVDKIDEKYLNSKKFMCQFYFQYSHKNMVSKFGVASLE